MATAAEHKAEIDRINTEVAAQAAKIATVSAVLTEKGSTSNAVGETAATPIAQNTADLDALITKANALPDAGGGGDGAVETCTIRASVDIPLEYFYGCYVIVTQCIDGNFVPSVYVLYDPLLIENVVCGSAVAFCSIQGQLFQPTLSDNMNFLEWDDFLINSTSPVAAVKAPTEPNAIGELVIM